MEKCRILFIGASPLDDEPLDQSDEVRIVQNAIETSKNARFIDFRTALACSAEEFVPKVISYKPHVIHVSCHGDRDSLYLKSAWTGESQTMPREALLLLAEACKKYVKVVTLSACDSTELAEEMSQHIPCVIGLNDGITDNGGIVFADAFYKALCDGWTIQQCFNLAKANVAAQNQAEEDVLELHAKSQYLEITPVLIPELIMSPVKLEGTSLKMLIRIENQNVEFRAHPTREKGIALELTLTNTHPVELKLDGIFIRVMDCEKFPIQEVYSFYGLGRSTRKYECKLPPKPGLYPCRKISKKFDMNGLLKKLAVLWHASEALPSESPEPVDYDYISLRTGELESFSIDLRADTERVYLLRLEIHHSVEGQAKVLSSEKILIGFFNRWSHKIGRPKLSPMQEMMRNPDGCAGQAFNALVSAALERHQQNSEFINPDEPKPDRP